MRDFYFDHRRDEMTFSQLASEMANEYDSDGRRLAAHSEHGLITLEKLISDRDISNKTKELINIVNHINILKPQCPLNF